MTEISEARVVLVAEDDLGVRNLVLTLLRRSGFTVLAAEDGQEALEISRTFLQRIDLLVTDIRMPRLDGIQLVKQLRSERPDMKIILMSGYCLTDIDPQDFPFLLKPFLPQALLSAISG